MFLQWCSSFHLNCPQTANSAAAMAFSTREQRPILPAKKKDSFDRHLNHCKTKKKETIEFSYDVVSVPNHDFVTFNIWFYTQLLQSGMGLID